MCPVACLYEHRLLICMIFFLQFSTFLPSLFIFIFTLPIFIAVTNVAFYLMSSYDTSWTMFLPFIKFLLFLFMLGIRVVQITEDPVVLTVTLPTECSQVNCNSYVSFEDGGLWSSISWILVAMKTLTFKTGSTFKLCYAFRSKGNCCGGRGAELF